MRRLQRSMRIRSRRGESFRVGRSRFFVAYWFRRESANKFNSVYTDLAETTDLADTLERSIGAREMQRGAACGSKRLQLQNPFFPLHPPPLSEYLTHPHQHLGARQRRQGSSSITSFRVGGVLLATGWALMSTQPAGSQPARATGAGVQVTVAIDSARARITERYRVPPDTGALRLQLLDRACGTVGPVSLFNYRDTIALASTGPGPWVTLRDTTGRGFNADSGGFDVQYEVVLGPGWVDIPLVQLTRAIPRDDRQREGGVAVEVTASGVVRFPRLARGASGVWSGRFVGVPSFVRIEGPSERAAECPAPPWEGSDDGGLSWRFWLLLGIMVAWVPLYLAWARRAQEGES